PGDWRLNATCANWYGEMQPPKWAEAAHYLSIAVALRPENPGTRLRLAAALKEQGLLDHSQGKLDESIAHCQKAIALNPQDAGAHNDLGFLLRRQGKLDAAVAACRKAIELDPKWACPQVNLGTALHDQKKLDEAIICYRKA